MYKVSEFARKAGTTVRTLHHYDRLGLLRPGGRSGAGYRFYGERELARLQQIATLKFIGLPLKAIKRLLERADLDLAETLRLQRRLLTEKRRQLEAAIQAIAAAESTTPTRSILMPRWRGIGVSRELRIRTNTARKTSSPNE